MHKTILAAAAATLLSGASCAQSTGPSTAVTPYLVPVASGVSFTSILSVGDGARRKYKGNETYRMVGIPDGLGAYDNGDGTFTVLMNHELGGTAGVPRAHGGKGAFVSKWQIRKSDLKVLNGEDLIQKVYLWDAASLQYVETDGAVFSRFCSADLPRKTAFFNPETGLGFNEGWIFMNGEESGPTGRAFAHVVQGVGNSATYELPALGRFSWENAVASPFAQDKTIVVGLDDTGGGKVHAYVGTKRADGLPIDQAGLTNGVDYQIAIDAFASDTGIAQGDKAPRRFGLATTGGTGFSRPEDGAWDTLNPNVFYFATTASFTTNSRLWKVTFDDITRPEQGGTIQVLVDGAVSGPKMMDNLTVDSAGRILVQEDPGNQAYIAKLWSVDPATGATTELAKFDPARFEGAAAITQDEESSGIIEVSDLFEGVAGYDTAAWRYFLLDAQVHKNIAATDPELVELGQLLLMRVPR